MKTLHMLVIGAALLSTSAFADTKLPLDQFVDLLAKNPSAALDSQEKTTKDPVTFGITVGKETFVTEASPAAFFAAARAKLPATTYTNSGATFVADYGRLTVKNGNSDAPIVYDLESDITQSMSEPGDDTQDMGSYDDTVYKVVSIVGNIVSYSMVGDTYGAGAAHPNYSDSIISVDVSSVLKEGETLAYQQANLAQLVDENSLVAAIKADKFLNGKLSPKYRKLLQGARTIQQIGDIANNGLTSGSTCYDLGVYDGKISNFSIYDYNAAKDLVSVRITMEADSHVCAGAAPTKQLGLLVKPRNDLRFSLQAQAKDHSGLLGKDAKK
jgi:hypothetical protein